LRRQTQVPAHRDAALHQKAHGRGHGCTAFELHHLRASLHEDRGVRERLLRAHLVLPNGMSPMISARVTPRATQAQ